MKTQPNESGQGMNFADQIDNGGEITGFPAYRITPDGQVWSLWRWDGKISKCVVGTTFHLLRFRSRTSDYRGKYRRIVLVDSNNARHSKNVHRLVLETFVGPCPDGLEACHNNGRCFDNRLDNLRWDTPASNQADRKKHGTFINGADTKNSKLDDEKVRNIRVQWNGGTTQRSLASRYGVARSTITYAISGGWRHVKGQGLTEYAILLALIAILVISGALLLGGTLNSMLTRSSNELVEGRR